METTGITRYSMPHAAVESTCSLIRALCFATCFIRIRSTPAIQRRAHTHTNTHSLQSWRSASQVDTRHLYWAQSVAGPNNDARRLCRRQRRGAMVRAVLQGAPGLDLSHLAIGHATLTTSCLDRLPRHRQVKPRPFPATCYVTYRPVHKKK